METEKECFEFLTMLHFRRQVMKINRLWLIKVATKIIGHFFIASPILNNEFKSKHELNKKVTHQVNKTASEHSIFESLDEESAGQEQQCTHFNRCCKPHEKYREQLILLQVEINASQCDHVHHNVIEVEKHSDPFVFGV